MSKISDKSLEDQLRLWNRGVAAWSDLGVEAQATIWNDLSAEDKALIKSVEDGS
jgi:hypothetical protein